MRATQVRGFAAGLLSSGADALTPYAPLCQINKITGLIAALDLGAFAVNDIPWPSASATRGYPPWQPSLMFERTRKIMDPAP